MTTVFVCTLQMGNFTFEAADTTEAGARLALVEGLHRHGEQYGLPHGWFEQFADDGQLGRVAELTRGACYRDGELLQ